MNALAPRADEGFGVEVPKGYIYAAIGFSVFIELINQLINRNLLKQESKYSRRERAANLVLKMLGTNDKSEEHEEEEAEDNPIDSELEELFGKDERNMVSGVLIALDRQERGTGALSAIQEVERDFNMPVISIVSLHVVDALASPAIRL